VTQNPKQADTRFLLGTSTWPKVTRPDAGAQFKIASNLMPSDTLAADLGRLNGTDPQATANQTAQAALRRRAPVKVNGGHEPAGLRAGRSCDRPGEARRR